MIPRLTFAAVLAGLLAIARPATADDPPPKKATTTEQILAALRTPVQLGNVNLNDIPLSELLQRLTAKTGVTFVLNEEPFKAEGMANIRESRPNLATAQLNGFTLRRFLSVVLESLNATFLVRKNYIEVVTPNTALEVAKVTINLGEPTPSVLPLVSEIYKAKPLDEVTAELAEEYDMNVVIAQSVGDRKTTAINVRLLNVTAEVALEAIAFQADLRVVRRGNVYLITTPEQAKTLTEEQFEFQRRLLELKKLLGELPLQPFQLLCAGVFQPSLPSFWK